MRASCALPRLPEAVQLVTLSSPLDGEEVGVGGAVAGLDVRLTAAGDRPVPLPLTVRGRPRLEIAQGFAFGERHTPPYSLRVSASEPACSELRERSVVDPDEPQVEAERPIPVLLSPLLDRVCPPAE